MNILFSIIIIRYPEVTRKFLEHNASADFFVPTWRFRVRITFNVLKDSEPSSEWHIEC